MTAEDIKNAGIPIVDESEETLLQIAAGFEWLQQNTILELDINNIDTIAALPSGAKLFVLKFCGITGHSDNVTSESIAGMSQSFSSENKSGLIMDIAKQLIGAYLKSNFKFVPAKERWRS